MIALVLKLTTEYNDLERDEVNIISGALELKKKIVSEVMTRLEDVFMLAYDTILDFETVSEIMKQGNECLGQGFPLKILWL
jgi:metal transporter CNNM